MLHNIVRKIRAVLAAVSRSLGQLVTPITRGIKAAKAGIQSERFDVEYHWLTAARHGECSESDAVIAIKRQFTLSAEINAAVSYFWPAFCGKQDRRLSLF